MNINMVDLGSALTLLWQGMLGIFIVMAVISIVVFCLTRFTKKK